MQGFNMGRYHAPDGTSLAPSKRHPLGARASKLASHGILTVRFEMPFAVWCGHCAQPTLIGQGVRFNAAKKRVGSYHSTPIWSFTVRHGACGGELEIRTDPARTDYTVVSGGRRRDVGADEDSLVPATGEFAVLTQRERAEQRETAFGKLERTIAHRERLFDARLRIGELQDASERQWDDPYAQNQRLRRAFRAGRREREAEARGAEELRDRMGLGIQLLPPTAEDARRAELVDFGGVDVDKDEPAERALAKPLFGKADTGIPGESERTPASGAAKHGRRKLKSRMAADKLRENLASEIVGNTRAARDPFLGFGDKAPPKGPARLPGLKRKRSFEDTPDPPGKQPVLDGGDMTTIAGTPAAAAAAAAAAASKSLVSYDSEPD